MIRRLMKLIEYNRDWLSYLTARFRHLPPEMLLRFRLRNGQEIVLRSDARFTLNEIFLHRAYDVPGVNVRKCRKVLDLGANMGVFAVFMAWQAPESSIYCFEPSSSNFGILERNLHHNSVPGAAFRLAVAGKPGAATLSIGNASSTEYTLGSHGSQGEAVECIDLGRVFLLCDATHFDFVKIDIEGAEMDLLNAATDDQLRRMRVVSMEWHHSKAALDPIIARWRSLGFEVTQIGHKCVQSRLVS